MVHSTRRDGVLIDIQSAYRDVEQHVRHEHAALLLDYDAIGELRALLDRIAEPREPRQPALWSDATFSWPVHTQRTRSKRRARA